MARPNRLVSAPEAAEYYYPSEFREASIEPVARGQYAQMFGSDSVINPRSWGGYLPEEIPQAQQAQINPEIIQYEKDLQQNETTDRYYGIVGRMHDMARTAAKGGFDINAPDPLNSVQRELSKIYRGLKQEALQIAEQAKQGREIEKNMPKLMAQNYLPADEQLRNQRGYYDPSALTQAAPRIENPAVKAFNLQTSPQYENTTDIGDIVAQRDRIVADLQYIIDNDPNPQNVQRAMDDLRSINQFAITKDYDPQKISIAREKLKQVRDKAAGRGDFSNIEIEDANYINSGIVDRDGNTLPIAQRGIRIVSKKKDGEVISAPVGKFYDLNTLAADESNDEAQIRVGMITSGLVYKDKDRPIKSAKNENEAIAWINGVKSLAELKQVKPTYFVTGTVYDKANVINDLDTETGERRTRYKEAGNNRTIIKPILDADPLKNNIIVAIDKKSGGAVSKKIKDENSYINSVFDAYNRKYEELSKGGKADKPKTIGW